MSPDHGASSSCRSSSISGPSREEGAYHEDVVNRILDDLVAACAPKFMSVVGDFNVRGGIRTVVTAEHGTGPGNSGRVFGEE